MTGVMPSGIVPGSIADNTYNAVTNAKDNIIPKGSISDTLTSIQEYMKFSSFIGNCVYQTIDLFVNKICAYVCV